MKARWTLAGMLLLSIGAAGGWAQVGAGAGELAAGKFLVARRGLPDPNFAQTVALLVRYGEEGAMGLVINRRTTIRLSRVLEDFKEAQQRSDPVYAGGPVGRTGVLALLRSSRQPEEAQEVFPGVYLIATKKPLAKALAGGVEAGALRVFLGYSGWGPGQLEREAEAGMWHILPAEAGMVFDNEPDTVWRRLIGKTELRIAGFWERESTERLTAEPHGHVPESYNRGVIVLTDKEEKLLQAIRTLPERTADQIVACITNTS